MLDDATRYRLLRLVHDNPTMTQRQIAEALGVSLGKVNFCMAALVDCGWVKIRNFRNSRNKRRYLYRLTPAGIGERMRAAQRFLAQKLKEHDEIAVEIARVRQDLQRGCR